MQLESLAPSIYSNAVDKYESHDPLSRLSHMYTTGSGEIEHQMDQAEAMDLWQIAEYKDDLRENIAQRTKLFSRPGHEQMVKKFNLKESRGPYDFDPVFSSIKSDHRDSYTR